ncbi:glutamine-hydrolyzing carbamoyl-phosphate synthase small subunit [Iamia sp.]|uniref:glutamine-hydrolyzing carbamoyl-phosphate synthase small subunit n=1 Tax=Iamia sp. TaxID=2722710 RepID=UPI002BA783CD|nr:glutamine-hydrolyzing carbamoyl-phosphate synthase small subunit [Iamia sp.]HXH57867.1 glutamine-hydrolyzing carbamoyl-phosphate synthase small subunit [Iamia sp.]
MDLVTSGPIRPALLVLADGEVFEGEALGALPAGGIATGEVVFNTVLTGYQEVISDPSYAGQIITFTYPHIGNYGVTGADDESGRPFARGVIAREPARRRSSWRSEGDLDAWLVGHGVPGIGGIDTRRLTRHIRDRGAVPGAFGALGMAPDGTTVDEAALRGAAAAEPGTDGVDLVAQVTTAAPYTVGDGPRRVVAYDFGIKTTILRHLSALATVEVVPASTPAAEVLARQPDGVFLANGPGDPATVPDAVAAIRDLVGAVPVFGICLGHQLLGRAIGAETVKLTFGHHGGNHPVRDVRSGRIDITSQNHSFAVDADTLPSGAELTHVNLNDGVCEGFALPAERAFSVQHHPEAGPGPHDAAHLFDRFAELMEESA